MVIFKTWQMDHQPTNQDSQAILLEKLKVASNEDESPFKKLKKSICEEKDGTIINNKLFLVDTALLKQVSSRILHLATLSLPILFLVWPE